MHPNDRPLYIISVAAELVNMHPQTLRLYERRGLVAPKRQGKNRLYSQHDIERLIYIQQLTQELGINLAGVEKIIRLQNELVELKTYKERELMAIQHKLQELAFMKTAREKDIKDLAQRIREQTEEVEQPEGEPAARE
jgi:MerR family transcriptional regulator/heat shock protein HspR